MTRGRCGLIVVALESGLQLVPTLMRWRRKLFRQDYSVVAIDVKIYDASGLNTLVATVNWNLASLIIKWNQLQG